MPFDLLDSYSDGEKTAPNYPPYAPSVLDSAIVGFAEEDEIIASDQPWAVAWYTDRRSLWLPLKLSHLETLENMAESEETPIVGVLTTPVSSGTRPLNETASFYGEYLALMLDAWAGVATNTSPKRRLVSKEDRDLNSFFSQYPFQEVLFLPQFAHDSLHLARPEPAIIRISTQLMPKKTTPPPSFENSIEQLEAIVSQMEEENLPLEELLSNYEKGPRIAHSLPKPAR